MPITRSYRWKLGTNHRHCSACEDYAEQVKTRDEWDITATPPLHKGCHCSLKLDRSSGLYVETGADTDPNPDGPPRSDPSPSNPPGDDDETPPSDPSPTDPGPNNPPGTPPPITNPSSGGGSKKK